MVLKPPPRRLQMARELEVLPAQLRDLLPMALERALVLPHKLLLKLAVPLPAPLLVVTRPTAMMTRKRRPRPRTTRRLRKHQTTLHQKLLRMILPR